MQAKLLPTVGPARKVLQEKGQFWTPDWVAEAMVAYVLANDCPRIFDPAVGAGAFFKAARSLAGKRVALSGMELDPAALVEAQESGLDGSDLKAVQIGDFALAPPNALFPAIVANPPYIRHHRIPVETKAALKAFAKNLLGMTLDGRAGLHVFFLLRALQLLDKGGRLAFIVPADTCEGVFAETLWVWITRNFRLEAVIMFAPEATPFPGVDTNAVVLMLRNEPPLERFLWVKCREATRQQLRDWVKSGFQEPKSSLEVTERSIKEGIRTGFTRMEEQEEHSGLTLGSFASVQRGIATGSNDFFFLTAEQVQAHGIPLEFLVRAIGRTRDVVGEEIATERLQTLEASGRPTYLLCLDKTEIKSLPLTLQRYLRWGEELGLPRRPLIAQRRPWYKMEIRAVPPFLFAYLGRRSTRFILNSAGILPLTGFLCIYPHQTDAAFLEKLWQILRHPETVQNLARVGKSYGSGAIKVEPRSLERLPIPESLATVKDFAPRQKAAQLPFRFYEKSRDYAAPDAETLA